MAKFEQDIDGSHFELAALDELGIAYASTPAPLTVGALCDALCAMYPPETAYSWDRTGLLVGDANAALKRVACALDPTVSAIRQAAALGANVLITHHPAFLDPPCSFQPMEGTRCMSGSVVFEAIRSGIALANWHTALDVSLPAQAMLPTLFELKPSSILEPCAQNRNLGLGQICEVAETEQLTAQSLAQRSVATFGRAPRVWGDPLKPLRRVCTWTGSAGDAAWECLRQDIDCLICGEVKYHAALDAATAGLAIIELGHDVSELPFASVLAQSCVAAGVSAENISIIHQGDNWA